MNMVRLGESWTDRAGSSRGTSSHLLLTTQSDFHGSSGQIDFENELVLIQSLGVILSTCTQKNLAPKNALPTIVRMEVRAGIDLEFL